ncbi:hypothetical protein [Botrimarina hoheduenensis]|uniref:Carboxypeptidase regulatory-like domain-containing protein n=1 Tax=Botrimarina hoheduenensis TaxID=2528000 RepID=A0A5C5WAX6_9BACT|nr:hypothetical protein [Botrimarina hoheduenensis]TWT47744.1 hypothetical protein Pla111_13640 [Botrimarina hoheduenensis]
MTLRPTDMLYKSAYGFFLASLLLGPLTGCGSRLATVTGTVSLGGDKVVKNESRRGYVSFVPASGDGVTASGSIDERGEYRLSLGSSQTLPPGEYAVSVRVCDVTPPPEPGGYSSSRDISPERYGSAKTSGLQYKLTPGSNRIEIALDAS